MLRRQTWLWMQHHNRLTTLRLTLGLHRVRWPALPRRRWPTTGDWHPQQLRRERLWQRQQSESSSPRPASAGFDLGRPLARRMQASILGERNVRPQTFPP